MGRQSLKDKLKEVEANTQKIYSDVREYRNQNRMEDELKKKKEDSKVDSATREMTRPVVSSDIWVVLYLSTNKVIIHPVKNVRENKNEFKKQMDNDGNTIFGVYNKQHIVFANSFRNEDEAGKYAEEIKKVYQTN